MSKNFPHDNIYSILGKLESLKPTPQEKHDALVQQIRESVEAKGSVLEGVNKIEAKLAHQFAEGFGALASKVATDLDPRNMNKVTMAPQAKKPNTTQTAASVADQAIAKGSKMDKGSLTRAAQAAGWAESVEECAMCEAGTCTEHSMEEGKVHKGDYGYRDKEDTNEKPMSGPKSNDPFGRTPDTPPSGKEGRKIKGKADPHNDSGDAGHWGESVNEAPKNKYAIGMAAAKKQAGYGTKPAHNLPKKVVSKGHEIAKSIKEGINFADMMKETDMTVGEMLSELQQDINTFKKTGHCSDKLEAFLKIHNHGKKIVTDGVGNPRGYPPGPAGQDAMALNPDFRTPTAKPGIVARAAGAVAGGVNKAIDALGGPTGDALTRHTMNKRTMEDAELNELARLAGLNVAESRDLPGNQDRLDVAEPKGKLTAADFDRLRGDIDEADMDEASRGEYISQQDNAAEKAGRDEFSAFGQTFDTDEVEEGNRFTGGLENDDIAIGQKIPGTNAVKQVDIDEMDECDMPGVPGMEKDGNISVNTNQSTDGNKNVTISADGSAVDELMQMLKIAGLAGDSNQAMSQPAEPEMVSIGDEGIEEEFANEPEEDYYSMDASTMGPGEGDAGEKSMYGGPGDNRMTQQPNRPAKPVRSTDESILALEASLAAEYESIKKVN